VQLFCLQIVKTYKIETRKVSQSIAKRKVIFSVIISIIIIILYYAIKAAHIHWTNRKTKVQDTCCYNLTSAKLVLLKNAVWSWEL